MKKNVSVKKLVYTALMTALVAVAALFIKIPGTMLNLCDSIIFITAYLFGGIPAMIAGGLGGLLADVISYPASAGVTLFAHGLEGLICGILFSIINKKAKFEFVKSLIAMFVSGAVMVSIYFIGKTFIYGTYESALVSLPRNIIQAAAGTAAACTVIFTYKIGNKINKK